MKQQGFSIESANLVSLSEEVNLLKSNQILEGYNQSSLLNQDPMFERIPEYQENSDNEESFHEHLFSLLRDVEKELNTSKAKQSSNLEKSKDSAEHTEFKLSKHQCGFLSV